MNLFDVYTIQSITPIKAKDNYIWDESGESYLDFYGGHAVISIGHSHPHYIQSISKQLNQIGFYSNSVEIPAQKNLADLLSKISNLINYNLFLTNSGAEANENALKLASFHTGKEKVIAFTGAFHGRTSGALNVTDNPNISSPFNNSEKVTFLPFNDIEALKNHDYSDVAAIIIESIQGVAGIHCASVEFLKEIDKICQQNNIVFIADEIQCGYGRTGKFFAFEHAQVKPHIITMAKGMGNGFPIGGILIHPTIKASKGLLGTTFGGNYLACSAANAVLEVIEREDLISNAIKMGEYLINQLGEIQQLENVRGKRLMIGFDVNEKDQHLKTTLLEEHKIFTGNAGASTIRLLPSLTIQKEQIDYLLNAIIITLQKNN